MRNCSCAISSRGRGALHTQHLPECPKRDQELRQIIGRLIASIEEWAENDGGMPEKVFKSYRAAKQLLIENGVVPDPSLEMIKRAELRPVVRAFAELMETVLRENDHKGGWLNEDPWWLLDRLRCETDELDTAILANDPEWIKLEAADVANYCMMIADVIGSRIIEKL
jgi:NTP pyrophosphatase (non-canonical NTP hydrolase)